MALNPNYLDSLPNTLVDMYSLVEIDILEDMARRISTYDFFIPSALHQNQKLQELGMVQEQIIQALAGMTGQTQQEIVDLLTEASEMAVADDVEYYKAADVYKPDEINTEALHKQLNSGLLQTQQAFKNITRTTANTATKQFENALDRAWTQINVGGMDYNTAIHRAIKDLSEKGIGAIAYKQKNGREHIDTLEVAVRRAVVTGVNQTAAKTQEVLADELGVDLVEVTAHGGARPDHAKWQGKCYSRNGRKVIDGVVYEDFETATRYGHGDGLCGWNCRHNFHPYVHGAPRTWTDDQIKALDKKNIKYNGESYTEYEASQIQRGIERDIRSLKRQVAAIEAGGGDASAERSKLRKAQKGYTDFTEQTGLKKQQARTKVATGTGTERPAPSAPKRKTESNGTTNLTNNANNDIILNSKPSEPKPNETPKANEPTHKVVEGKNIQGEYKYTGNYDYDIEDVIHEQGYDGIPKVVKRDEFEKAMKKSNFYAERTYSADSMETLEEYRKQLYTGKFYVDCSTGGAQYGQGMYCAACYDLDDAASIQGVAAEMQNYQSIGKEAGREYHYTEAITLQPDAKILKLPYGEKAVEYISDMYTRRYIDKKTTTKEQENAIIKLNKAKKAVDELTFYEPTEEIDAVYAERNKATEEVKKAFKNISDDIFKDAMDAQFYISKDNERKKFKNEATLAAEMGYDAINADGHGESNSYTVILNRTKIILCEGGSIYGN